ncbi:MAG TPA: hypothetical protein VGO91_02445 [Pyrinomonadaceae bacterium]|jgi:hypothetical protein|nr:hypothetical protein [Pyrinomonadaceae bacterium]
MKKFSSVQLARRVGGIFFSLFLTLSPAHSILNCSAQTNETAPAAPAKEGAATSESLFHLEKTEVAGGAELLTIFGELKGLDGLDDESASVPLVSVLRDTLNDRDPENDRLRYMWMLTYTKPSSKQRLAAAIPFLYNRVGNKGHAGKGAPPPILDLSETEHEVWQKIFWSTLQNVFLDSYGLPVKFSSRNFRRNLGEYRKAHILRALAVLSLYQSTTGAAPALTDAEMRDMQARLMLTDKIFGGIVDEINLEHVYQKGTSELHDTRGHNWELLRQRAEAESLFFDPLEMPDGSATHAIVWATKSDLLNNHERPFNKRFLNVESPWQDRRLLNWTGYTETRYFDAEHHQVSSDTPGARPVEMIPLALYGLDHPKIPILLVDFRSRLNPKEREMSRRVFQDVTRTMLGFSRFGDLPFFVSRTVYEFVTGRRGMDLNQPSRLRAYSQLKLLLSLDASLDPQLRDEVSERLERVSLNPLENSLETEAQLAREQYAALMEYAKKPDGLPARLDRDRRAEMVPLKHGRAEQAMLRLGNVLSFGLYTHRERATDELAERLETQRRLAYHGRFLREVAKSSPQVEVVWNMDEVKRSLNFIAEHGTVDEGKAAKAAALIFARTSDTEARELCLKCLYRINNETAKNELLRIAQDQKVEARWRHMTVEYLKAMNESRRPAPSESKANSASGEQ